MDAVDKDNLPPSDLMFMGLFAHQKYQIESSSLWDNDRKKWYHYWVDGINEDNKNFFEKENERNSGLFCLYAAREQLSGLTPKQVFNHVDVFCDNPFKKWHDVHPNWSEGYINPLFEVGGFGAPYGAEITNPNHSLVMQKRKMIYDGSPYFFVSHCDFVDVNKPKVHPEGTSEFQTRLDLYEHSVELEDLYMLQHPFHAGRTLGELFKLIMDWDICFNSFNNREPMAILCHNVMMSIDMPADIYEIIYKEIPNTVIYKYLKNEENAMNFGPRPQTPTEAVQWFKEKYWDLRNTKFDIPNITSLNEHYYRRRTLI
jgi:hypothetical protein